MVGGGGESEELGGEEEGCDAEEEVFVREQVEETEWLRLCRHVCGGVLGRAQMGGDVTVYMVVVGRLINQGAPTPRYGILMGRCTRRGDWVWEAVEEGWC